MAKQVRRAWTVEERARDLIRRYGNGAERVASNRADATDRPELACHYERVMDKIERIRERDALARAGAQQ